MEKDIELFDFVFRVDNADAESLQIIVTASEATSKPQKLSKYL